MKPYKYTKQGNKTIFHYHYKDLRNFLEHGFKHGDNGFIICSEKGGYITYKGFGTLENPVKIISTIMIQHHEPFDGVYSPDLIVSEPTPKSTQEPNVSFRFTIFNFNSK